MPGSIELKEAICEYDKLTTQLFDRSESDNSLYNTGFYPALARVLPYVFFDSDHDVIELFERHIPFDLIGSKQFPKRSNLIKAYEYFTVRTDFPAYRIKTFQDISLEVFDNQNEKTALLMILVTFLIKAHMLNPRSGYNVIGRFENIQKCIEVICVNHKECIDFSFGSNYIFPIDTQIDLLQYYQPPDHFGLRPKPKNSYAVLVEIIRHGFQISDETIEKILDTSQDIDKSNQMLVDLNLLRTVSSIAKHIHKEWPMPLPILPASASEEEVESKGQTIVLNFAQSVLNNLHAIPKIRLSTDITLSLLSYLYQDIITIIVSYIEPTDYERVNYMYQLQIYYLSAFNTYFNALPHINAIQIGELWPFTGEQDFYNQRRNAQLCKSLMPVLSVPDHFDRYKLYEAYCHILYNQLNDVVYFPIFQQTFLVGEYSSRIKRLLNSLPFSYESIKNEIQSYFTEGLIPDNLLNLTKIALRYLRYIDLVYYNKLSILDHNRQNSAIKTEARKAFKFFINHTLMHDDQIKLFPLKSKTINYQAARFWGKSTTAIEVEKELKGSASNEKAYQKPPQSQGAAATFTARAKHR